MNLQELRQKLGALCDQQQVIADKAITEGRGMTEDEIKLFDSLQAEIDSLDRTIKAAEELEVRAQYLNQSVDHVRRPAQVNDRGAEKPWRNFGEFLLAVRAAAEIGVQPNDWDPRLKWVNAASGVGRTPGDGGFLVERDVATEIISNGYQQSLLAPLCRKIPIGANSDGLSVNVNAETSRATGSRWGGVQVYWRGEGDTVTATKPKLQRLDLSLEDLMGLCYITREMERDAVQLGAIIQQAFAEEIAWTMDDCIVNGNGVGKPLGVLNSAALVTVAKESGQAAATIVTKNLSKMWARLWSRSRGNAVWLINQDIEPELDELAITVGTVGALEPRFINYGPEGALRIKGRPVVPIEQAATLGTVGDIILADLSQYVLIDKGEVEAAESIHVRFIYGENTYRFMYRVNGMPYWISAITPANGSNTLSPYIVLATRA